MSHYGWLAIWEQILEAGGHQLRDATLEDVAHYFEYTADDFAEAYLG